MKIRDMFKDDINREITGVVKVAQQGEEEVYKELREYVITNELRQHFDDFFEAYNKSIDDLTDKMGVWVSGFFGSGKSHFIKILSYLLENREVKGNKAIRFFEDKIDDEMMLAEMQKACNINNEVILFNIDSKSDTDVKSEKEAIEKVFMKVFNEHLGYCGSIPWLAELERKLDEDGNYEAFKNKFEELAKDKWENKREDFYFEEEAIIESLASTTSMSIDSAKRWYRNAEDNYSMSIEKFAKLVNDYIERQNGDHHLVFLVDEVGQYIGDKEQLMLNLQTVTEDLGTHCGGKAWVGVTSQETMDEMISRIREMDFSKIMGRFDTRLNLSSANVDEVIIKRLLKKNETAKDTLELLYKNKDASLNNLISFSEGTYEMKNYSNAQEFIDVYPFIPYQFKLLQEVFEEIRRHGATGKHLSEGERSLLSAFQEAAQKYQEGEEGELVPFSSFFEPIKSILDSNIRRVISKAYENENLNDYDVEVLKLLFLIRYIEGLPGDSENITTLMIENIDQDKLALEKEIKSSLRRLRNETLIQKDGNEYYFLTNEEQDINREIKDINVDITEAINKIGEIIFEGIYTDSKFNYDDNFEFGFNKIVDNQNIGKQTEDIGVRILTPYYSASSEQEIRMESQGENNVIIKLSEESDFIEEIEQSIRVENYLRRKSGKDKSDTVLDIMNRIGKENAERKERVSNMISESIRNAEVFLRGRNPDLNKENPRRKIELGLKELVEDIYDKMHYIEKHISSKSELNRLIDDEFVQMSMIDEEDNELAYNELLNFIENMHRRKERITLKSTFQKFTAPGYGWPKLDIAALLISMLKNKEINLIYNEEFISSDDNRLIEHLTKRKHANKLLIEKREKVPKNLIEDAEELARDLFGAVSLPSDEDELADEIRSRIRNEIVHATNPLLREYEGEEDYPGKDDLEKIKKRFNAIITLEDLHEFYQELSHDKKILKELNRKLEMIKGFFENQIAHFDGGLKALELYEKNKTYIEDSNLVKTANQIKNIVESDEPYEEIHKLPDLRHKFNQKLNQIVEKHSETVKKSIKEDKEDVKEKLESEDLDKTFKENILKRFEDLIENVETTMLINEINGMKQESKEIRKASIDRINERLSKKETTYPKPNDNGGKDVKEPEEKTPEYVDIETSSIFSSNLIIKNEEDLEKFLNELKEKLYKKLEQDKYIKLG